MRQLRQIRRSLRLHTVTGRAAARVAPPVVSAVLVALLGACAAAPAPRTIELAPQPQPVVEGYVARARLDPGVAGARARVEGAGARVMFPLEQLTGATTSRIARRVLVGGFVTSAPGDDRRVAARHVGAQADVRLTERPILGTIEPLASLGVGSFRARQAPAGEYPLATVCLRPADAGAPAARCLPVLARERARTSTDVALSPAVGVRLGILPGLALRADARDVVVYRGAPRHNPELAVGLSFSR